MIRIQNRIVVNHLTILPSSRLLWHRTILKFWLRHETSSSVTQNDQAGICYEKVGRILKGSLNYQISEEILPEPNFYLGFMCGFQHWFVYNRLYIQESFFWNCEGILPFKIVPLTIFDSQYQVKSIVKFLRKLSCIYNLSYMNQCWKPHMKPK